MNPSLFAEIYHDRGISAAVAAERLGIHVSNLSKVARQLGLKTRRELGIKAPAATGRMAVNGCNKKCPEWDRCRSERLYQTRLPCEPVADAAMDTPLDSEDTRRGAYHSPALATARLVIEV